VASVTLRSFAPLPLRLMLGIPDPRPSKLGAQGHAEFAGLLEALGVPAPAASAWVLGGLEVPGRARVLSAGL
jgi:hypothetical protein